MMDLEGEVIQLEEENKRLMMENEKLKQKTGLLSVENQELKERLGIKTDSVDVKQEPELESAVLSVPPQQGQAQVAYRLSAQITSFLLTLR